MSIPADVRDLLAALRDSFDLPPAAHTDEDEAARRQLLDQRAYNVHAAVDALLILEHPSLSLATRWLRHQLGAHPAAYTRLQGAPDRAPGLCPPCQQGDCEECLAIDHPDLPTLYSCHYVAEPHAACRRTSRRHP